MVPLPDDPSQFSWIKVLAYASLASLGGVLGHLLRIVDAGEQVKLLRAFLEGVAAGFVGVLFLLSCQAMNLSPTWTGVIVGLAGWLGANASIKILEKLVYKKLGIAKEDSHVAGNDQTAP